MANTNVRLSGSPDRNRPDMVKITMIFYKTGLNRVPKVLSITGPVKNWDGKTQRFRPKTEGAAENNALLAAEVSKYQRLANDWESQGMRWTPKDLSHYYDKPRELVLRETVIPTVEQVYKAWIAETRATVKMKNGHEVPCEPYADTNRRCMDFLARFLREKYGRPLKTLEFTEVTEQFLKNYVFFIESEGAKNNNRGGIRGKLHSLYRVVQIAEKKHVPGADVAVFGCTNQKFRGVETVPATISLKLMRAMENMDRSLLSEEENYHLDLFLFSYYCGGMGPMDAAYLTWRCIDLKRRMIVYERIKTTKKAKPPFVPRVEKIIEKYRSGCYGDFVLPIFGAKHDTHAKKKVRMGYMCNRVNMTLRRIVSLLGSDEEITWYSARGTYITMMIERGYRPEIVAEHSGNSPQVIYKFYYKNTKEDDIIADLCSEFDV